MTKKVQKNGKSDLVCNEKIKNQKTILLFVIIFVVSLIMCFAFLQPHYTHDTYKIIYDGYEYYSMDKFLKEARPFTAILTMIAGIINLPIEYYSIISFIIALFLLSASVVIVYKMFAKKFTVNNSLKNIIIVLISYILIFNYLAIEHIYFLECCIMSLGVVLSTIAAKVIIDEEKNKYIKAFLLIVVAVFCYQGSIAIFPIIVLTYKMLFETNCAKENIKVIISITLTYGIAMLLTILFSKFIMSGSRIQIFASTFDFNNLTFWLKELIINSLGVIPPYVNLAIIIVTLAFITLCKNINAKEKIIYILKYLFVIFAAIGICLAPILFGSGLDLTPRMCMAYGSTIGVSLFVGVFLTERLNSKTINTIFYIITIIIFLLNFLLYVILTNQHILVNKKKKKNCEKIGNLLEKYEKDTGKKVTILSAIQIIDISEKNLYYNGTIYAGAITQKALNSFAIREAISFYLKRHFAFGGITDEKFDNFFNGKNWTEFSEEQVVFEDSVMYFCAY